MSDNHPTLIQHILTIFFMLLMSASIVYVYNENINEKLKNVQTELKWYNDGSNKVLMIKRNQDWYVVPTEVSNEKRYYPTMNNIK